MPKVLTSLSDRGRCNRNNNSNSNNHASAPRRYQLIALLGIKALACVRFCVSLRAFWEERKERGPFMAYQIRASPSIPDMTMEINIVRPVLFLLLIIIILLISETIENASKRTFDISYIFKYNIFN